MADIDAKIECIGRAIVAAEERGDHAEADRLAELLIGLFSLLAEPFGRDEL